ncbi:nucleotidyl transferase AbiEii/AbiGii toxin family protein [Photorhabdus khanii]|uniref:Nucleotidyl transferase AbiEii/AbiGii toxin family protein n=1 Tax=Photorhabdus khanii TaxID=1004150 RepID=A0A7C9KHN6_9GAMM|nr:nucleotidyl transferase AbiEii/AbiGii toxin family protein [Photorhabdus khanii]MQL48605.1 nucleotidyl transferase AbiEii/AbiGii toxin family protein [Photorhabdus khanii]
MDDLLGLFADVADALGIGSVSIVEKDYYVVELLRLLQPLVFDTHKLVFAGGTALAKAGITLNRMSEDVDIKLVPQPNFLADTHYSRTQRKNIRKAILQTISEAITTSGLFGFDDSNPKITRDEYRYNDIPILYPQHVVQAPCLKPFIKLELMESDLLETAEQRDIRSFVAELTDKGQVVAGFPCVTIISTQAEKLVAMLRRTAAFMRNIDRKDDESLVRHLHDNYCIVNAQRTNIHQLAHFVQQAIEQDIQRYGRQYPQFQISPVDEIRTGLEELENNPVYQQRYQQFVIPMVFENSRVSWAEAYDCFRQTALSVLDILH